MNKLVLFWTLILSGLMAMYVFLGFGETAVPKDIVKNVYTYLTPIALGLVGLEMIYCWLAKKNYITFQESIANFGTAIANQTTNVLVAVFVYVVYGFLHEYSVVETISLNVWTWILLLVGVDFLFYWFHRFGHHVNILWAAHSPHHSAEEMNLMVGLRASVTQRIAAFFFLWPLTLVGFHPIDIYIMTGVHLFIGYWHHTEVLPKFWWWIEYIFNTPSHHRAHHGMNVQYLDKNFAEFLIIWDRIFGTFEEENEKVVYGMYHPPQSWNPIKINFHYYITLWKDAVAAPYWWDKIRLWFMPLTWRPRGLPPHEPLQEITVENQVRYQTTPFKGAKIYLITNLIVSLALMLLIIKADSPWTIMERWIGAAVLWHTIVNWGGILESDKWLPSSEVIRILFLGAVFILFSDLYLYPLWMAGVLTYVVGSLVWVWRFFRPLEDHSRDDNGVEIKAVIA